MYGKKQMVGVRLNRRQRQNFETKKKRHQEYFFKCPEILKGKLLQL